MPLPFLIVLVVGGIAGIAVLLHVAGLSRPRRFESESDARAAWSREYSEAEIRQVILAQDRSAALIVTNLGPGVVWAMGADSTARLCPGAHIAQSRGRAVLHLPDYTAPRITLALDPDEIPRWQAALQETS